MCVSFHQNLSDVAYVSSITICSECQKMLWTHEITNSIWLRQVMLTPFFTACNLMTMRGCNYYFVSVPTRKCQSMGFKNFFSWAFGSGLAVTRTYQWLPRIFCLLVPSEFCTRRHSSPVVWHSKCWAGSSSLCRGQSRSILWSTRFYHFCLLKIITGTEGNKDHLLIVP